MLLSLFTLDALYLENNLKDVLLTLPMHNILQEEHTTNVLWPDIDWFKNLTRFERVQICVELNEAIIVLSFFLSLILAFTSIQRPIGSHFYCFLVKL